MTAIWLNREPCLNAAYMIYMYPHGVEQCAHVQPKVTTPKATQFSHLLTFYTNNAPDKKYPENFYTFLFRATTNKHFWHQGLTNPHTISPPTHSYPTSEVRFYFFTRLITLQNSAFRFVYCLINVFINKSPIYYRICLVRFFCHTRLI